MLGVSVVIPCFNEKHYIKECLDSLINNGFPLSDMEILVVDGGSTDGTLSILKEKEKTFDFIKVLNNVKQKTPFALNIGVSAAQFECILIAGAHAKYPKNYISELYGLIQKTEIDVVGGAIDTQIKNQNAKARSIQFVLTHPLGVGNSSFRIGAKQLIEVDTVPFGLYNKKVFDQSGLYNEKLIRNHDIELSKRILSKGFRIWLNPKQKVVYYARENYSSVAKNNYANGFWNLRTLFITRNFKSLSLRHYIPLIFVLSILLPLVLGLILMPWLLGVSAVSLFLYLAFIATIAFKSIRLQNPFYIIWSFITLHFSYGMGSLMGGVVSIIGKEK